MKKQKLLNLKRFKIAKLNNTKIIGGGDPDTTATGGDSKKKSVLVQCLTD